jgi:hypothetical protein
MICGEEGSLYVHEAGILNILYEGDPKITGTDLLRMRDF